MKDINWATELGVAITVSDTAGKILYMNNKSASTFSKYGGRGLEGSNLKECHKKESWEKILDIMDSQKSNCYTIEKEGIKKLIYQAPWYEGGIIAGMVEISIEIPLNMEHFIRG